MTNSFRVKIQSFSTLREIEGARTAGDYSSLLDEMEYGDQSGLTDDELREICIMSLQDMSPVDAAFLVLKHDMADVLRDGQIRNIANEMLEEKLWEEYSDSSLHERLFNVGSLLYAAFPRSFPEPDAVHVTMEVIADNTSAREELSHSPNEPFLVRLLADGMDDHAILHRLYSAQLKGPSFPNADEVIWIIRTEVVDGSSIGIEVISSGYWLDALEDVEAYDSLAYSDATLG